MDSPNPRGPAQPIPLLVLFGTLLGGCGRYEIVLLEPVDEEIVLPDSGDGRVVLPLEPLDYRLSALEDEFVILRVTNTSDEVVEVLDDRTYPVDPDGETHQVAGAVIAPRASITFALPPLPTVYTVRSPYGGGWRPGHSLWHRRPRYHLGDPFYRSSIYYDPFYFYDPPRTYYVTEYPPGYWEWGTGRVRLHLAYRKGDQTFDHEFVFLRRRSD